jgi:hypothetical protein
VTVADRILSLLRQHPEGLDDDQVAAMLGLSRRQHANQVCRLLESEGLIDRNRSAGKIKNFPKEGLARTSSAPPGPQLPASPPLSSAPRELADRPWHWEGNVQAKVASHLVARGWTVEHVADTASKAPGKDLIARKGSVRLWVSVKGYPQGTTRTNPATQARHWFSHAMFDMILWRDEDAGVSLACAFPDFPTYRKLATRSTWFAAVAPFHIMWVSPTGAVEAKQ